MAWYQDPTALIDKVAQDNAQNHQNQLTKPTGSLGQLEQVVIRLAGMQGAVYPSVNRPYVAIFAADHGVMAEGVSAYPQAVTGQMLANFAAGGACVNAMAGHIGADVEVINCGVVGVGKMTGVVHEPMANGTHNFLDAPAMSQQVCNNALNIGMKSAERAHDTGADIYVAGEMGIGNTCSASALACLLLGESAKRMTGRGTGINDDTLNKKTLVVAKAVELYQNLGDPLAFLAAVGGFEMAAMTGAYIRAAQLGLPVVVDGFISMVSALTAVRINAGVADWLIFGHRSQEQAHGVVLSALQACPILDLGLRLGEGSGALASLPLIRLACDIHKNMATFEQAGVANKS